MSVNINGNDHSVQAIEDSLRYVSAEKQRMLLRRALDQQPNDQVMYEALARLTTPRHIRRSAQAGVFINYTRADELLAIDITTTLTNAGVPVWMDMMHIVETSDWRSQIANALQQCGLMLALISPAAMDDADVNTEQDEFLGMGKLILPVVIEPIKLEHRPFWQTPINLIRDPEQGKQQLLRLLMSQPATV